MATQTALRSASALATGGSCRRQARAPAAGRRCSVRVVAQSVPAAGAGGNGREEALRQMQQFRSGLSTQLEKHEEDLKRGVTTAATSGATEVAVVSESRMLEISSENYDETIANGVAVVMWTSKTCGPCKLMMPKLEAMAGELPDVQFAKIWTSAVNKDLGKSLGIRAAPTFIVYKNGEKAGEVNGAKDQDLRNLIDAQL